jgi:transposase-like protein
MVCHSCRIDAVKAGKQKDGSQRYKCQQCGKRYTEPKARMLLMTSLPAAALDSAKR